MPGQEGDDPDRLQRILEAQRILSEVAAQLGPDLRLDDVLVTVLTAMRKLVSFRGGSVQLVDDRGVYVAASDPPVDPIVGALRVPVGEGLSGRVVATGETMHSPDLDLDNRVPASLRTAGSNQEMRSYLAVPLVCLGETIGALQIDAAEPFAFDEDDIVLLQGLAAQVAAVIESARRFALVMELERLKHDFVARVSHELRTPITIVEGFIALLLEQVDEMSPEQRRDVLRRSRTATSRLARLIEDLIALARLETGAVIAHPEQVVIQRVLDDVRLASGDPELVEIHCDPTLTTTFDPELVRRSLGLLVDNALKYGGQAVVVVAPDGRSIEVRDEGPGISDDVKEMVFELFTRGNTQVPGLGLGLPMARTLAAAAGLDLTIIDRVGGGTIVRIALP